MPIDWGNAAAWFSAIGSTASFSVAARVYWQNRQDTIRGQASKVTVERPEDVIPGADHYRLRVTNNGDGPVYGLKLHVARTTPGGFHFDFYDLPCEKSRLNPNTTWEVALPPHSRVRPKQVASGVVFQDGDGRWWVRHDDGFLVLRSNKYVRKKHKNRRRSFRRHAEQASETFVEYDDIVYGSAQGNPEKPAPALVVDVTET
jgi:hypothetical protein